MRTKATLFLALICACGERAGDAARGPERLDQVIVWDGALSLEETPEVVNVAPRVSVDPRGGYLVADMKEFQVRRYADRGRLEGYFGARGGGPGAFTTPPVVAVRLDDGAIAVGDFAGGLSLFDSLGHGVRSTARSAVLPLYAIVPLPTAGRLLLIGRGREEQGYPLLHLWDRETNLVQRSFFPAPAVTPAVGDALWVAAHAHGSRHDSTVAVVFSADPRIHFFGLDGSARGSVPIPFAHFRPLRSAPSRRRPPSSFGCSDTTTVPPAVCLRASCDSGSEAASPLHRCSSSSYGDRRIWSANFCGWSE